VHAAARSEIDPSADGVGDRRGPPQAASLRCAGQRVACGVAV